LTRPQTPCDITATLAWKEYVLAAWGGDDVGPTLDGKDEGEGEGEDDDGDDHIPGADGTSRSSKQGIWIFRRGKHHASLPLPTDLHEPIRNILIFGSWIVASATSRIEVWKTATYEHYTTLHSVGAPLSGGICTMPTYLNKIFVGRADGWVQIWNVSTGKLVYTILPPSPDAGAVTCLQPTPALSLLAVAYGGGAVAVVDVLRDRAVLRLEAGTEDDPVTDISFRSDGLGAGSDGRKDGVMATATKGSGDVTFWDLNHGGRIMGVLRGAHYPPSSVGTETGMSRGGISKIEFLPGQPVIVTSGNDNSLKTWIFDETPFSPVPRILHSRSGHAGPVTTLQFLPSDFDGADQGNKWLLSGGADRSLWGWSLRRDGQSTELSQGAIRKKAKKSGILGQAAIHGAVQRMSLDDLKAPEIVCIATSLNRDGGIGAIPGKVPIWQRTDRQSRDRQKQVDAEVSGMTGWESVVTAHKDDPLARTWFWGRKRAGRWAFRTGDGANVSTVAISPCGSFAVVGSEGGAVDMWNLQSGQHRRRFPSKLTPAQARQMKLQQLKQADEVAVLLSSARQKLAPGTGRHLGAVTGLVVDSLNKTVVSCSTDGKVKFWDFLTGTLVDEVGWGHSVAVTGCRYHAANDLLAFSCSDHTIRVVDLETKKTVREFRGAKEAITDFCFSADGRWLVAASRDAVLRVWDLPTSHLIDAVRLERPCTALAISATGEYLATALDGSLGVHIWTNTALFKHVQTRQISEEDMARIAGPTSSGEGGQGVIAGAFDEDVAEEDGEDADGVPSTSLEQLSKDMMTLSLVPRSRWQTLLQLDVIKARNKPKEAPKLPEKAPFFLPGTHGIGGGGGDAKLDGKKAEIDATSRITRVEGTRAQEDFARLLREGARVGNCRSHIVSFEFSCFVFLSMARCSLAASLTLGQTDQSFIAHLKSLSPSTADLELRSLSAGDSDLDPDDDSLAEGSFNEHAHFIRACTSLLVARRDFELAQAWMTVFLRLHFDDILDAGAAHADTDGLGGSNAGGQGTLQALAEWRTHQARERERLDALVGYCAGVVGFLRSPRT
jgi:U3 small nucleolar RNA-associated protein 21